MISESDSSTSPKAQRATEIFLARQPILGRGQDLVAYELLFRSAAKGPAGVLDDLSATAAVIAHAAELGMDNVIGNQLGFVNADAAVLQSDFISFLPPGKVVLEILETVRSTPELLVRIKELKAAGYTFALDDVIEVSDEVLAMMDLVSIIKVDIEPLSQDQLKALAGRLVGKGKTLLAEKVETREQFEFCLALGFDLFQGYYFARPVVMSGKALKPSQAAVMQVISLIATDADNSDIEKRLKQDASLSFSLLRLVSSPGIGAGRSVDSLGQAMMILGRHQLQRWLHILLYAQGGKAGGSDGGAAALLGLATSRGKLLELVALHLYPGQRALADIAFTVGIMSLIDTLFSTPMEELLTQLAVSEEVAAALLRREGVHGELLQLAESAERIEDCAEQLVALLHKYELSGDDLCQMQLSAYEWSVNISKSMAKS